MRTHTFLLLCVVSVVLNSGCATGELEKSYAPLTVDPNPVAEIPGGEYSLSRTGVDGESVFVSVQPFAVAKDLVTIGDFVEFLNDTGMPVREVFYSAYTEGIVRRQGGKIVVDASGPDLPARNVTWIAAKKYCEWLGARDPEYVYRLPTELEWEYLASNGGITRYPWGDKCFKRDPTRLKGKYLFELPVGSAPENANQWGVRDLIGSLYQFCQDYSVQSSDYRSKYWLNPERPHLHDASIAEKFGDSVFRTIKGGTVTQGGRFWPVEAKGQLPTATFKFAASERNINANWGPYGFRWVREPKPGKVR